ncbi:MAG: hypothetical protein J2O48_04190 [Solirubrobacterales bacterium]|nr:hypothetical protein [Solirubrobacterales bacterium]
MKKLTAGVTVGALLASPAVALAGSSHTIVLGRSIGPVKLGQTPAQVQHELGKPAHTYRVSGKIASEDYTPKGLVVSFDTLHKGDPVEMVTATSSTWRTSKGIRTGSTTAQVEHAYSHLRHIVGGLESNQGTPGSVGSRSTLFNFFHGKVQGISVTTVFNDI